MLRIQLLGHFQAQRDGSELPGIRVNGTYRLLALMVLQANRPVRNTWVAEALWPDTGSLDSLRKTSQKLREALGPEAGRLRSENNFLRLDLADADIDVLAFDTCVNRRDYLTAVERYTGPLLQGVDETWVLPERKAREERYCDAIHHLVDLATGREEFALAAQLLSRGVSIYPDREEWWTQLIAAQAKCGARLEALTTAQNYLATLKQAEREFGMPLEPTPALMETIRRLQTASGPIAPEWSPDFTAYEAVGGAAPLDSPFYVERPEELEANFAIRCRASIVLIKGARQTGKSSLLARAVHRARREGATVLRTECQKLTPEDLAHATAFYRAQARSLAAQLEIPVALSDAFPDTGTPSVSFERFLLDHIFTAVATPLVWTIDDADRLFSCPFRDDVFALLRSWHNERAYPPSGPWHRLTLVLAYAAEAHLAIRNLNQSPFNVGTRVTLGDFTLSQLRELNARQGNPLTAAEVDRLYELVGGHPYLVRRTLHEVTAHHADLENILSRADQEGGIFADHLHRLQDALRADADLCADLGRILAGESRPEASSARLFAGGVLVRDAAGGLRFRCRLYDLFLRRRLP